MRMPWLYPYRADVLAALALVAHQRQPLDRGFARLAEGDPLLRPWSERLGPALAAGEPLVQVLQRHRLIDRAAARTFSQETDPVAACDRLARESLVPVRGLLLIRWFPVALAVAIMVPVAVMQLSGVMAAFESIFKDLNICLPMLTVAMLDRSLAGAFLPLLIAVAMFCLLLLLKQVRGVRHLQHLWWVEVHRQTALLELVEAAIAGDDAPRHLPWPVSWGAAIRLSSLRQDHPIWDRSWRTWRILTRWRALNPGWRDAAHATTAVGVLQSLGLLPSGCAGQDLEQLRTTVRQRLVLALEPAHVEARAMLMVGFAIGLFLAVMAMFLPLISIVEQLN